ncbi:MAG: hypothetical protein RR528_08325, partial [Angelakisella sp.]
QAATAALGEAAQKLLQVALEGVPHSVDTLANGLQLLVVSQSQDQLTNHTLLRQLVDMLTDTHTGYMPFSMCLGV